MIRHAALSTAALAALMFHEDLQVGNGLLALIGAAALANLLAAFLADRRDAGPLARFLSPFLALAGWSGLVALTGGVASPFLAGFWLEIILSALARSAAAIGLVTGGAVLGLWSQQSFLGLEPALRALLYQTGFLLAMGATTAVLARHWARRQGELHLRQTQLRARLAALEEELESLRVLGRAGEHVAWLAHGLKNAVHTLRGFTTLIEPRLEASGRDRRAVEGLQAAIDRLEEIARLTLPTRPATPGAGSDPEPPGGASIRPVIDDALEEVSLSYPDLRWRKEIRDPAAAVRFAPALLHEVLLNLARNAAEAMGGRGEALLGVRAGGGFLEIEVRDGGHGISPRVMRNLFRPGYTTTAGGSGFGLFLARRLVEAEGGELTVAPSPEGGARFSIRLPTHVS